MSMTPVNTDKEKLTAIHQIVQVPFSVPLMEDEEKDAEAPRPDVLERAARSAGAKIGTKLYESGVLNVERKGKQNYADTFRSMEARYEIRCAVMKDPHEIEKKFQEARERIEDLEREKARLQRKLRSIKDTVSDEI